jgi:hypothetical protein
VRFHEFLIGVSKTLFSYQIYLEAEATPGVEFLLRNAKEKSGTAAARAALEASRKNERTTRTYSVSR